MKERFIIFITLLALIAILIAINAASFVNKEKVPDTETNPNRSSYNTGATGTRALYDLLAETGHRVTRWQEPAAALSQEGKTRPDTLIIIGSLKRELEAGEIEHLLHWVEAGGKLIVIDREPHEDLLPETNNWKISADTSEPPFLSGPDPSDQKQMTQGTAAAKPVQPTVYTTSINAVQPSRYASSIVLARRGADDSEPAKLQGIGVPAREDEEEDPGESAPPAPTSFRQTNGANSTRQFQTPKPVAPPKAVIQEEPEEVRFTLPAPLVHLASDKKNILADFTHGEGRIVYLTDPYIVSNGGITLVDNAQLALNVISSGGGLIAFDEYHQGFGGNKNELLAYFAGTPLVPVILQLSLLIGLIFFSRSRRFARALPEDEPNRLSKLEYVAAMAELQQRTKAFDLAVENIYTDFRRRVARAFGVDNFTTSRADLAQMIAERLPSEDAGAIDRLMHKCEDVSHGEKTNKKEVLELAGRLRELEEKLGLQRRKKTRQK